MADLTVGETVRQGGYVLLASHIRGRSPVLLEQVLGYRRTRLSRGWYLLFLLDPVSAGEFELHGYTHFSGGKAKDSPLTAEQDLRARGVDVDRIKRRQAEERFKIHGPDRIAKVVPVIDHSGIETYPPGAGIPQWRLGVGVTKRFKVKAFVAPGQIYLGDYSD
jgi:hypothetical protein